MWKTICNLAIFVIFLNGAVSMQLKNITKNIFGDHVEKLPVAFGDFNSDKLTDLFVINQDRNKLSILLATEQTFSSVLTSHTYFQFPSEVDKKKLKLECAFNDIKIESIIPGDGLVELRRIKTAEEIASDLSVSRNIVYLLRVADTAKDSYELCYFQINKDEMELRNKVCTYS